MRDVTVDPSWPQVSSVLRVDQPAVSDTGAVIRGARSLTRMALVNTITQELLLERVELVLVVGTESLLWLSTLKLDMQTD